MSEHPNVATVNKVARAAMTGDKATLADITTEDMVFHILGPIPGEGDHNGASGLIAALGSLAEAAGDGVEIDQQFCMADDGWAAEWERADFKRNGETLETSNAFVYRFRDGRVAEMWMLAGVGPGGSNFFD